MASVIKAGNATDGVQVTSDNTGILELKTGTGAGTTAVTIGTDQSVTFAGAISSSGNQTVTGNLTVNGNTTLGDANTDTILMTAAPSIGGAGLGMGFGFRNRIINGGMVIDQRNAGASVSFSNTGGYTLDRWLVDNTTDGTISVQQSSVAPTGFTNSCLITVTAADASLSATQRCRIRQPIEGFNVADFGFGAASATTVTLSFWVRSSLTGTFGGALNNSAVDRSYPFSYTINSANTWEYKTVTIAGDTSGTWLTNNGIGLIAQFGLGIGSTFSGTAGSWVGSQIMSTTGATSLIGTNGATFYITGVQLEKGSTATSFDYRPYSTELQLCQRYYFKIFPNGSNELLGLGWNATTTSAVINGFFPVTLRAAPSALEQTGTASDYFIAHANTSTVCSAVPTFDGVTNQFMYGVAFTVASGLTAGQGNAGRTNSTSSYLAWSAEL